MTAEQFLRLYGVRAPGLSWFLGAGASVSSGMPSADDMIWDFKRAIYCSAQRVSLRSCEDLGDPVLRQRLQSYFDSQAGRPEADGSEEYSSYFEAAYPNEADRRRYIEVPVRAARPSIGFAALAALMNLEKAPIVFSTNFDRLLEDAATAELGSSARLTVATLDSTAIAVDALNESRWPLYVKLHGDFGSRRLKNTSAELQQQDAQLRNALVSSAQRFGIVVAGYSGRDESIMTALEAALDGDTPFPNGLFWLVQPGGIILPRVAALLRKAALARIEAATIEVSSFDEIVVDVLNQLPNVPASFSSHIGTKASRISEAPLPAAGEKGGATLRLNALPIIAFPSSFRLISCDIGGSGDVRAAVEQSGLPIFAARKRIGVIAIGSDADLKCAFESYGIKEFLLQPVDRRRLRDDSTETGLLLATLAHGLAGQELATHRRRSRTTLHVVPEQARSDRFKDLLAATGQLFGVVRQTTISWSEACVIRLGTTGDTLWLYVRPMIYLEIPKDPPESDVTKAKDFVRERQATRYNTKQNALLVAWVTALLWGTENGVVQPLKAVTAIDTRFQIGRITAFSRRSA